MSLCPPRVKVADYDLTLPTTDKVADYDVTLPGLGIRSFALLKKSNEERFALRSLPKERYNSDLLFLLLSAFYLQNK